MNKDWLDIGVLEDYLDGKLDAKTMNRVEREALDDPFVAEALAGLSESPARSLQTISLLQKQLRERVAEHQSVKKTSVITWQRLSIAATAAVMFVAVSVMFWMREQNQQKELAGRAKKVEVTIAPPVIAKESAPAIKEKEIEKAIVAAKTTTYAARVKKKTQQTIPTAADERLNEVAVVGYGVQRRQAVTGSVSSFAAAELANVWSGKVTAQDDGKPLSGVSVNIEGTKLAAVTDVNGEFKFSSDTSYKEGKLNVNSIGFKTAGLLAKANQPINITLLPDHSSLNELQVVGLGKATKEKKSANVVIRGMSTAANQRTLVSNPVGGWPKLWRYIAENNVFKDDSKTGQMVEVSFKITKDGDPTDLKIEKSADARYEQEAIRLILNGPKWERPKQEASRMTFKIDF